MIEVRRLHRDPARPDKRDSSSIALDGLLSTGRSPHSIVPSATVIPSDWTKGRHPPAERENAIADDSGRIAMSMLRVGCWLFAAAVIACAAHGAQAEVTRVEIAARTDVLGGKPFGDTGSAIASFGPRNAPGKRSGLGTIVRAGICSTTTQSNLMTRWDGSH